MGDGLFAKLERGVLRFCFIDNVLHANGARHPLAFGEVSSRGFSLRGERENGLRIVREIRAWCAAILLY